MPIYEYQCEKCRRILNFLVRNVAKHQSPSCPKCGHPRMSRVLSRFSAPKKRRDAGSSTDDFGAPPMGGDDMPPGMDSLMAEAEGMDENDPRAMGRFMRKMADQMGEPMPAEMNEMVRRLEAGEDPEQIEADMGDVMGADGSGEAFGGSGADNTLYDA